MKMPDEVQREMMQEGLDAAKRIARRDAKDIQKEPKIFFGRLLGLAEGRNTFYDINKLSNDRDLGLSTIDIEKMINNSYQEFGLSNKFDALTLPKKYTKEMQTKRDNKKDGGLLNPEKADLDNDGKLSSYEEARGEAIEESIRESKQKGGLLSDDKEKFAFGEKEIPIDFREEFSEGDKADSVGSKILKVLSSPVDFIAKLGKTHFEAGKDMNHRLKEKVSTQANNRLNLVKKSLPVIKGTKSIDELKIELKELYNDKMVQDDKQYKALINNYFYHFKNKHLPNFKKEIAETGKMPKDVVKYFDDYEAFIGSNKYRNPYSGQYTRPDLTLPSSRDKKQVGGMMMDDQMDSMMQREELPELDNQMADMMPEEKIEEQKAIEKAQAPDEMMEENYVDFLIDEALSDEEEGMLMQELQANPQLSMLFDKVMEVAMEFSGSGPVEGPGSEVSDSIPARLSDGEFVFTAKAVDVLGADNLMLLMKQAEAQAEQRQPAQEGGLMEEENVMPVEQQPVEQNIRVTKETVGSQAAMQEEEDLVGDELKKSMLSTRPYVRS